MFASAEAWRPAVTVAAVIERGGRFLLVEERTSDGLRLNQPAGHLEPGETLIAACIRETLEETSFTFTPSQVLGIYLWQSAGAAVHGSGAIGQTGNAAAMTFLRFAFTGLLGTEDRKRRLDEEIVRTLWLTADEIAACASTHRSPLVMQCVHDYLRGERHPLSLLHAHPSALRPQTEAG